MDPITLTIVGLVIAAIAAYPAIKEIRKDVFKNPSESPSLPSDSTTTPEIMHKPIEKEILISYTNQPPDNDLASQFETAFSETGYQVFLSGQQGEEGEDWVQEIEQALAECDYFILLLSQNAANSEMILEQVRRVKKLQNSRSEQRPKIIPILLNLSPTSLNHLLSDYLDNIPNLYWTNEQENSQIIEKIKQLLEGQPITWPSPPALSENKENSSSRSLLPPVADPQKTTDNYIKRPPIEEQCYEAIDDPNERMIRLKSPQKTGKTALIANILNYAKKQGYQVTLLNFLVAETQPDLLNNINHLLKWFCRSIIRQLKLPNTANIDDYWDTDFPIESCKNYFEDYILNQLDTTLVISLDNVDVIFPYSLAEIFFSFLRVVYEEGNTKNDRWKKLRLILAHSTEVYLKFPNINMSPFNVGIGCTLRDFDLGEVQQLAAQYIHNSFDQDSIKLLMAKVGGHPHLLTQAFYYLKFNSNLSISTLANNDNLLEKIYEDHLKRLYWDLTQDIHLFKAIQQIIQREQNIKNFDEEQIFKLRSLGLIEQEEETITIRYPLYKDYFSKKLGV